MELGSRGRQSALQTIPLGPMLGIPIGVHYSWFVLLVPLAWVLAVDYYPAQFQGWSPIPYWILSALTAILLFVAVLLHELGHALVARHYQVPVRGITLFVFGGVAQTSEQPLNVAAELWVAVAGPLVSFALAAVLCLLQAALSAVAPWQALAKVLAYTNGTLALFNLIPGYPLDGGRALRATLWAVTQDLRQSTLIAANLGRGVSLLFIVLGMRQVIAGNLGTGLWFAFVGWFLETVARTEVRRQDTPHLPTGHSTPRSRKWPNSQHQESGGPSK